MLCVCKSKKGSCMWPVLASVCSHVIHAHTAGQEVNFFFFLSFL